jgi:YebC/PmpR family DNA-binding regulatory protein
VPVGQRRQQGQFGVFVSGDDRGVTMIDSGKWWQGGNAGSAKMRGLIINHLRSGLLLSAAAGPDQQSSEVSMAGHSKWANIQHRKGRQDEKRSASFSKIAKEITVSAKMGGGDPSFNPRLRLAIDKGKGVNMPKDKIDNAIKKGTGEIEGVEYVEIRYEGYGIGGAAVIVDCLTDNKTRTVADVRHAFNKYGGNLGTDGCVAFQFRHCGQLLFAPGTDEAALMDAAIEAGADDVLSNDDGSVEVITAPNDYMTVKEALEAAGFRSEYAGVTMKAENETQLGSDESLRMQKLIDALESLDDVQEVYTSVVLND